MATSLGEGIALQGRTNIAEQIGRMQFQAGEAEKNRQAKLAIVGAEKAAKQEEQDLKKFALPSGTFHRLVLPDVQKTQVKYLDEFRKLKQENPQTYQNAVGELAAAYDREMAVYATRSKDLNAYDLMTATQDKGSSYFSNNWKKFNTAYENASDWNSLLAELEKTGWQPDAQLGLRPNGSINYTPVKRSDPQKLIEAEIFKIPTVEFKSSIKGQRYGYSTEIVKLRPVTREISPLGVSVQEVAQYNPTLGQNAASIEDVVDDFLLYSPKDMVFQYADQNNLNYQTDDTGQLTEQSYAQIKDHIMGWAEKYSSPTIQRSFVREHQPLPVDREEGSVATFVPTVDVYASTVGGDNTFQFGNLSYSFDKDAQQIAASPSNTFTDSFNPVNASQNLSNVKASQLVLLGVDKTGKPIKVDPNKVGNSKENLAGVDLFVQLQSGGYNYYQRIENYGIITSQFLKKPNNQLEAEIKRMNARAAQYDALIAKRKQNRGYTWETLIAQP